MLNNSGAWEVWLINADGTERLQLTDYLGTASWPSWFPDGAAIIYYDRDDTGFKFFRVSIQSGEISAFLIPSAAGRSGNFRPIWSPSGDNLLFDRYSASRPRNHDLFVYNSVSGAVKQLTAHPAYDSDARWSPDGRRIAYTSQPGVSPTVEIFGS